MALPQDRQALMRRIALRAQAEIDSWPQWKKDEYDREEARFREMGRVARFGYPGCRTQ